MKSKMIRFLLEHANPSIRYRVRTEILGETVPEDEAHAMQAEILAEPIVQLICACQKENGWLGNGFHGPNKNAGPYENQEVGTKYLGEKLIFRDAEVLARAMDAYVTVPLDDLCYRTHGKYYDEFKYAANGQNIIRCACIARAGYADKIDISPQIQLSLDSFRRVNEVDSILDISRIVKSGGKEKRVFNKDERWPCWYHLDILAHTDSWKSEENVQILADSVNALMRTDRPEKQVGADSWVGHVLGCIGGFKEGFSLRNPAGEIQLDRCEWLCRCGVTPYVPALREVVDEIAASVDEEGVCRAKIDENQLHGFSTYGGQQLEVDWKAPVRRDCDVTYRALLILHYGGYFN
ncbi:MAG: hypothetical protein IJX93_01070 [Clostridia bacterium]|nr:hypothetical protein [Clostridia bacterium]